MPAFGDVGYVQGPGNLSSYLIALATGSPQATGGLFSLTAPLNFGPNFGLIAVNYTSTTVNPATAGQIRLAKTDTIDWRNNANTLNLALGINGADQLIFNGSIIALAAGTVTSVTGTANQINSTGGATPVLSLSSTLIIPGTFTIPAVTNQIILGTTNTITLTAPAPAASRVYTIPDVLSAADFVMTVGAQSIAGVKTFTGGSGAITMSGSTIIMGGGGIVGSGNLSFSPTTAGIVGTTTNNNAQAGNVGEVISQSRVRSARVSMTSTTALNVTATALSLTAGDWDVYGAIGIESGVGTSFTSIIVGISTTSATQPGADTISVADSTGQIRIDRAQAANVPVNPVSQITPSVRISIAGTTTYFLVATATFSVSTAEVYGSIVARRVR